MKPEEYAQMLAKCPSDSWVALSEDESSVVATGLSMAEVVSVASHRGVEEPVLLKTPIRWGVRVL